MYKIETFVPEAYLEPVKRALFEAGAGQIGDYEACCAFWPVTGQFKPNDQATPFLGVAGQIETVEEFKLELVCQPQYIKAAISALRCAHPYEEPAYFVTKMETLID